MPIIFYVNAKCTILCIKNGLINRILLLESKDRYEHKELSKNYALFHLYIDDFVHLKLRVVSDGLPCFVCSEKKAIATL